MNKKTLSKIAQIVCFGVVPFATKCLKRILNNIEAGRPTMQGVFA